nr:beta-propeller fold lactonase family protein [Bradyrhizobium diazoefficiens]
MFVSEGRRLLMYAVEEDGDTLLCSVQLPQAVQYAALDCRTNRLYVACSDGTPYQQGTSHHLLALKVQTSSFHLAGEQITLSSRPIHLAIDDRNNRLFVTYNGSPGLSVHPLDRGGEIGTAAARGLPPELHYPHQVFVPPFGSEVVVVCRGSDGTAKTPELPGCLSLIEVDDNKIVERKMAAPDAGYGFGPRSAIYDDKASMVYISLERQNRIAGIGFGPAGFASELAFSLSSLRHAQTFKPQLAGALRMHPRLRILYQLNRTHSSIGGDARSYGGEGENTVVAYHLGGSSPRAIQRISTEGIHPRTLSLDDEGRLMAVANLRTQKIDENGVERLALPGISLFAVSDDGQLSFLRQLSFAVDQVPFWSSFASEVALSRRLHAD